MTETANGRMSRLTPTALRAEHTGFKEALPCRVPRP